MPAGRAQHSGKQAGSRCTGRVKALRARGPGPDGGEDGRDAFPEGQDVTVRTITVVTGPSG